MYALLTMASCGRGSLNLHLALCCKLDVPRILTIRLPVQSKPTLTKAGLAIGAAATLDFLLLFPVLSSLFYGTHNSNLSAC